MAAVPGDASWTSIALSNATTYDPGLLTTTTKYVRKAIDGTCGVAVYSNELIITVRPQMAAGAVTGATTICYNTDVPAFGSTTPATGGDGVITYTWQYTTTMAAVPGDASWTSIALSNATTYDPGLLTTTTKYVRKAVDGTCGVAVYSNQLTITVQAILDGGAIGSIQTICSGGDVAAFTNITSASGGAGVFTYTWQYTTNMGAVAGDGNWIDIPASNNAAWDYGTLTTTTRFIRKAAEGTCTTPVYSNILLVTVRPALQGGTIGSNQTVCFGTDVAAFTNIVAPSGGDNTFTYTWQYTTNMAAVPGDVNWTDISSSNSIAYDYGTLSIQTRFLRKAVDISCNTPVYSNIITIGINPLPITAPIVGDTVICQDAMNVVYQIKTPPAHNVNTTYTWSVPSELTITSPLGLYFIIVDATGPSVAGDKISVYETYNATGCKGSTVQFPIIVSTSKIGENVKGTTPLCRNASGIKFWVSLTAGSSYNWSLPPGAYITSNPDSAAVFVTFPIATAGNVSVVETQGACTTYHNPLYIIVNALPTPALTGEAAPCINSSHVYTTDAGMSNYVWTVSAGGSITSGGGPGNNTATITWNTGGVQSVSVNYTNANGCIAATPKTESISVYPLPVPTISGNPAACLNSTGNVYNTESGMTNYIWTVSAGGSITSGGGATDNSVTVKWDNTGIQTITVNYTNINGCTAVTPTSKSITVNALPTPTISGPTPVCTGSTGNTYQTELSKLNYIWTVPAGGVITAGGTGYDNVMVIWTTTGTKTITVNYTDLIGCTAASATTYSVVVNALPVPTITGNATACQGSTANTYTTETPMTNYLWIVSAGGTVTGGGTTADNTVTVTWNTAGAQTVSVNYTDANGCTATSATVKNVIVNALPVPTIAGNSTACQGSTGNTYTTESGMTNYLWTVSAGGTVTGGGTPTDRTVTVTWTTAGAQTVTVNYINSNGCTATTATVKNVTVDALPVPTLGGPVSACVNSTGNVYTTEASMTNYLWNVTGGTITAGGTFSNTITVTWNTAGPQTVKVNYTDANGCTAALQTAYAVTVNALPAPTVSGPSPICVTSTGNLYTTQPGMTNYAWTVSAGGTITGGGSTTDNTVTVTWNTAGTQTISVNYTDANGCTATTAAGKNVTVNALPVPTITGNAAACQNSAANIYSTQVGMTNYLWSVSAGGTISSGGTPTDNTVTVTWTVVGPQTVSVNYTNSNGCTATTATVKGVTVNALPAPTLGGATSVCLNSTGNIYTTETGMTNYLWNVTGGTITAGGTFSNTITVTWNTAGAQTVKVNYTDANGCTAALQTSYAVTVNALPAPTVSGPSPICVTSTGNLYTTQPGMTNYAWTVSAGGTITGGGSTTDNTVTVTWNTAGTQTVSVNYTDANGCTATTAAGKNVTVNALPVPTIAGNAAACQGSTGNIYTTQAGMTSYLWIVSAGGTISSGGTPTDNTVTVTWTVVGPQTVSVNYTNSNGCTATTATVKGVTVNVLPIPTLGGAASVCVNSTGNIYTTETGMTNYLWNVTGGSITAGGTNTNTITVTWNTAGPQTVKVNYTDANGCTATAATSYAVTVNPLPVITIAGPTPVCVNSTGNIYTTQAGMTNYMWTVSAGGTITSGGSTGNNTVTVTWTTVGAQTVSVNYTDASGCTASAAKVYGVTVNPLPVPTITGNTSACLNSMGNLYTTEAGMTGYTWSITGGTITAGGTPADRTATVTWTAVGPESISVKYTDANGCTAATPTIKNVTVNALTVPTIVGAASVCVNSTGHVYTTDPVMTNYLWNVTGGTITAGGSFSNTITVTWNTAGPQTVSVNYTDGNGCTATTATTFAVTVNPLPVVTLTGPTPVCVTSTGNTYTTDAGMTGYAWSVSPGGSITGGGTATDNTVTVTWNTIGAQTVSVNYVNANGCSAATAKVFNVTVNALPVPTITGNAAACQNSTANIYSTQAGMTNYLWSVSAGGTITAGGTPTDNTVTVTWTTVGAETVSVNYTNGNGCTAASSTIRNVTVNALPAPTLAGPASVCVNSIGNVYSTEPGMSSYIWTVSAGGTITSGGGAGNYTVTVAWNAVGPQSVSVNYNNSNGCTAATATSYAVTVNALPVVTITGPASVCKNSTDNTYNTEVGQTNYLWTVSSGGVITAGGIGYDYVTITWTSTGPKTVTVNYTNAANCTAASPTVYNVTVNALPTPSLSGIGAVCETSAGNNYSTEAGMTNYIWTVSAGGTVTAGGTAANNSVTVTWNIPGAQSVSVNYTNGSGCTATTATVKPVTVNALPVPTITGNAAACMNSTGNFYTTEAGMINYSWVVTGGSITSGGTLTDNTVTITWNTVGAESVSVNYTNVSSCTAATPTVKTVTVNALPVVTLAGPASVCKNSTGNIYTTQAGMSNYLWVVSAGGTITSGGTTGNNSAVITWNTTGPQSVSVNYTNANGCTAAASTAYAVTVNPLPVPALAGPLSACVTSAGNLYTSDAAMTNYIWTVSSGGTITAGGTATDNSVTITWNTAGTQSVSVNYTNGNGCTAATAKTISITINPLPVPTISGNTAACVNSTGNIYTTQVGMTGYTWGITGGTITGGGTASDNTATVTWSTVGTGTISVNYTNGNGCTAATPTINNVTVNALPVPTIVGPASVCQNSTGNIYTTESGMTNYIWVVSAGGMITAGGSPVNNTIVVTWNTVGPQSVKINYNNANGCTAAAATVYNVTVNALPVPAIAGPTHVCATSAGNVYTTQAGMTNYVWTVPAGGIITSGGSSTDNTVTVTWNGAGVRTVKVNYTNLSGCTAALPGTYNVTINPLPLAVLAGGETICSGQSSILNVTMLTGNGPYTVNIQNIAAPIIGYNSGDNITVTPLSTTTYTLVSVTDAFGCIVTSPSANLMGSATVIVRAPAFITTQPVDKTICEYGVTFFSTVAGGTDITYQWYESQGGSFAPLSDGGIYFGVNTNKLNLYGTTRLMDGWKYHIVINNCSADVTSTDATLTVNTIPEITKEPSDTTICSTQGTVFKATATGTTLAYQWQVNTGSGFGNIDVNPSYTGHIAGATSNILTITNALPAYNDDLFMIKVSGACGSPVYSTVVSLRVNTPPAVTGSPTAQTVCDGAGTVYFRGRGTGMIDSLRWQVNTGSGWNDIYDDAIYSSTMSQQLTVINPPVSYNGYQYRLALKAYCAYSYTNAAALTVHPNPVVSFVPATIPACGGVAQTLTPVITSGSGTWNQHTWTGDIGPLNNPYIQTPVFRTLLAGRDSLNYKVRDSNMCYGNSNIIVLVDAPDATFIQDATTGCTPLPVQFTKDMTGYTSFTWDYGDGSAVNTTLASPPHTFTDTTKSTIKYYTASLKVNTAGGCFSTKTTLITVFPAISAAFTSDKIKICSNETITFTALQGAHDYSWDYGDGVAAPGSYVASHKYTNFGTSAVVDTVTLTTTSFYSCTDKKKIVVTVMPVPAPLFTANPASQNWLPAGNPVTIVNTTANLATWIYAWKFGDGNTSTAQNPPVLSYTTVGTFTIRLTASNSDGSCTDSTKHNVIIKPLAPIASFDSIPNGCEPQFVTFNNTTQNQISGTTYMWDFGDNNYSRQKNPTYTYQAAGDYKIVLTVTGPAGDIDSCFQVVHIYQSPRAYFQVTPSLVFVNDENIRCFNLTTNGDTYKWDFGDGETSTEKEPFHKYMAEGIYDITLWARSANDCYDKYILSPAVTVQPAGVIRFASVFTPNLNGPEEPTVGQISADQMDKFFYPPIREKVINYKLQIFNRLGVLIFQSDNIETPWNGYYKGKLCPQGVYVWYVEGKYATGKVFKKVGDITLLH
jgi:PKD repeat protein